MSTNSLGAQIVLRILQKGPIYPTPTFSWMFLNLGLSYVFFITRLKGWVWGGRPRGEVPFSSHHIKGTYRQHDTTPAVNLDYLAEVVLVRFLYREVPPLPSIIYSLERSYAQPTLKGWRVILQLLKSGEYIHKLFGILHGRFVYLPSFIYSFNHF